ncbi:DUF1775 domain-containing protein [Oerskovia sp. NPDC056781]|uniref:DUF1775 domain-containing protein n=1 Tax=Oerskovia sp. NPDC056781 TaxID=3345942 RepID=UPI00366C3BDF
MTRRARAAAALGLAALLTVTGAQVAAAHVLLETATPNGDGTTTLTFSFEHGCDGAPTTGLDVTLPAGVEAVSTVQPEGWAAEQEPGVVRWEGTPVADGTPARFELVTRVTGTAGQAFWFPTTQTCTEGSYDWVDTDPAGAHPAPSFVATTATLAPQPIAPGGLDATSGPAGASLAQTLAAVAAASLAAATAGAWYLARRRA